MAYLDEYHVREDWHDVVGDVEAARLRELERRAGMLGAIIANVDNNLKRLKLAETTGRYHYPITFDEARQSYNAQYKVLVEKNRELKEAQDQIDREKRELKGRGVEANRVYGQTRNVQKTTGKNKIYIGNMDHVRDHAQSKPQKAVARNERRLDSGNWSWGVNLAWVHGGIDAGADFKFKLDDESQWASLPEPARIEIEQNPYMTAEEWLDLCRRVSPNGSLLWKTGTDEFGRPEDRPTWTALEVATLIENGYHFAIRQRRNSPGEKILMTRH